MFCVCLCSVYKCLYIHRGNGERHFLPFICSGSGGRLVGWCCWFWFAAAAGGGDSGFSEFERITDNQICIYSLETRGYFTLFRAFPLVVFAPSGSSIHTQLKTVPSTPHLYPPTYHNGLPNGKTHQISIYHYPPPNSNYLKINLYTTITNLLHYNYININISTSSTILL